MEFLLFLFILLCAAATSAPHIIPVSSELRPASISSVWLSDSGAFAFGFYGINRDVYTVCIFLTSAFFQRPVVWAPAATLDPFLPNNNLSLLLNHHGIRIFHYRDGSRYFSDIATTEEEIAGASMLDNGNFVLYNSKGAVIWQSFDNPTDTLLPGQRLPTGRELVSRASYDDPAWRGVFRLKMQSDGNLVQYPAGSADTAENAYYDSNTYGKGSNMSLNLDSDGRLYLFDGNSSYYDVTSYVGGDGVYLARVDPDGIFRLYTLQLDGKSTVRWSSTEDRCAPKGICGVNSICAYEDDGTVTCTCLPGFGNGIGMCREDFGVVDCGKKNSSVRYEMRTVWDVTWKDDSYAVNDTIGEEECARACLDDCDCVVALFKNGKCRKQKSPIKYGRKSVPDSNTALVRVSLPALVPPPLEAPSASGLGKGLSGLHKYVIIGVSIGIAALVMSSTIIYFLTKRSGFFSHDEESSKQNVNKFVLDHGPLALKRYSYKEIRKITKSFAEKLGQGGYGIVYKGKLPNAQLVAVKVLIKTHDNADEFFNEVASISKTSHVNIVNLLGFCFERKKRALVYEFMPNKSLAKYIQKRGSVDAECSLEWNKLYEIAVGVARGLEYLHRGCNTRIVHFDIKPQNILLDQHLRPKISDFGLAKLCVKTQSAMSMLGTRGTIGYIAPEVFSRNFGAVSHKSDVYSYGIMLLQMAKARTNVEIKSFEASEDCSLENIYKHVIVQNEKMYALMTEEEEETGRKMLMIGFWCIQTSPSERPSMNKVVEMLVGNVESIQIPPLPFLLSSPKPQLSCLQLSVIVESQSSNAG